MERAEGGALKTTEDVSPYWIRWMLPSIGDAIFLIIFLFLVINGKGLLADADTGWHIGIGRYILETWSIPKTGIYSYTAANMPWMAHEWLTELIFAWIHDAAGLNGIVFTTALIIAITHYLFFKFLVSRGVDTVLSLILTIFVITVTSVHWLARPHILSMLITLVWYMALQAYRVEGKRYLYLLPLIMVLWVNLHGGFMAGLLLIAVYWLGSVLDFLIPKDSEDKEKGKKDILLYGKVGFLSICASLLNPHGYKTLLFPFQIMGQKLNVDRISEWLSPNFHEVLPYEYMLLTLVVILGFSKFKLSFIEAGLVILWTHLSLHSVRYGPLFAIIVIPIMAIRLEGLMKDGREAGNRLLSRIYDFSERIGMTSGSVKGHAIPIIAVILAAAVTVNSGRIFGMPLLDYRFDKKKLPVDAVEFAEKNGIKGRIFNTYHFGGYLIYRGFPKEGVFVDGRADMYNEFLKNYYNVVDIKQEWKDVLKKFDIDWMLITANSSLSVLLLETDEWRLTYADKVANIFVRKGSLNEMLIDKYKDVKLVPAEEE